MKTTLERQFIRCGRKREWMFQNERVALRPREYNAHVGCLDGATSMVFDIMDREERMVTGELAIRLGEGPSLFYLGHIGYHVNPPWQGHHVALQACRLCFPLLRAMGMRTLVITTDEDNLPSIHTCEGLQCALECTVDVPHWCVREFGISLRKRRYILTIPWEEESASFPAFSHEKS